jgi:hypothetical protein
MLHVCVSSWPKMLLLCLQPAYQKGCLPSSNQLGESHKDCAGTIQMSRSPKDRTHSCHHPLRPVAELAWLLCKTTQIPKNVQVPEAVILRILCTCKEQGRFLTIFLLGSVPKTTSRNKWKRWRSSSHIQATSRRTCLPSSTLNASCTLKASRKVESQSSILVSTVWTSSLGPVSSWWLWKSANQTISETSCSF